MSDTKKGTPRPGKEHWSKRPMSFKDDKKLTIRAERHQAKEVVRRESANLPIRK